MISNTIDAGDLHNSTLYTKSVIPPHFTHVSMTHDRVRFGFFEKEKFVLKKKKTKRIRETCVIPVIIDVFVCIGMRATHTRSMTYVKNDIDKKIKKDR